MPDYRDVCARVPFLAVPVHAGFPSPGDDYAEQPLNLHDLVVPHPTSSYFIRVRGHSMAGACIHAGDVIVVDRSLTAATNTIVVVRVEQEMLLKRVRVQRIFLHADPSVLPVIEMRRSTNMEIWGVVTYCIHRVR
jgi:DNA polymerase V